MSNAGLDVRPGTGTDQNASFAKYIQTLELRMGSEITDLLHQIASGDLTSAAAHLCEFAKAYEAETDALEAVLLKHLGTQHAGAA